MLINTYFRGKLGVEVLFIQGVTTEICNVHEQWHSYDRTINLRHLHPRLAYCAMGAERETGRKPQGERQGPHAPCEVVGGELDVVGRGAKQQ